jgi:hypothetical protein
MRFLRFYGYKNKKTQGIPEFFYFLIYYCPKMATSSISHVEPEVLVPVYLKAIRVLADL